MFCIIRELNTLQVFTSIVSRSVSYLIQELKLQSSKSKSRKQYGYHSIRPMHDMTDRLTLVNIVRHILMPSPGVIHSHIPPVNPL